MQTAYELGILLSLKDYASSKLTDVHSRWMALRKEIDTSTEAADRFEGALKKMGVGLGIVAIGMGAVGLSKSMVSASVEVTRQEGLIRSLGVSMQELNSITQTTGILSAKLGISQERMLSGIYDIKSAASDLNNASLAGFAQSVADTALATRGNFENLSKTFGMVYNQFRHRYKELDDVTFARNLANDITWAANKFRADGETIEQAFTSLGSSAAVAGVSLEEQSAVIGRLLNTMRSETAGVSFRYFLDKMPEAAKKLGISAFDASGKMRTIPDILEAIHQKFPNLQMASHQLDKAFTEEGVKMLKELIPHLGELRSEIKEIQSASAAHDFKFVDEAKTAVLQSYAYTLDRVREGAHALWVSMGRGLEERANAMMKHVADLLEWLNQLSPSTKAFIGTLLQAAGIVTMFAGVMWTLRGASAAWQALGMVNHAGALGIAFKLLGLDAGMAATATVFLSKAEAILTMSSVANTAALRANALSRTISVAVLGLERTSTTLATVAYGALTGRIGIATAAQWAWNTALAANPVGLVIVGVVALTAAVAGLLYFSGAFDEMFRKKIDLKADDAIDQLKQLQKELRGIGLDDTQVGAIGKDLEAGRSAITSNKLFAFDNNVLEAQKQALEDIRSKQMSLLDTLDPASDRYKQMKVQVNEMTRRLEIMKTMRIFAFDDLRDLNTAELLKKLETFRTLQISAHLNTTDVDYAIEQLKKGNTEFKIKGKLTAWEMIQTPSMWNESGPGKAYETFIFSIDDAIRSIPDRIGTAYSVLWTWMQDKLGSLGSFASEKLASLSNAIPQMLDQGISAFGVWIEKIKIRAYEAGRGFLTAFTSGIRDFAGLPLDQVLKVLMGISAYLPHSDADMGPLSTLTASGRSLVSTFAGGIDMESARVDASSSRMADVMAPDMSFLSSLMAKPVAPSDQQAGPMFSIVAQNLVGQLNVDGQQGQGSVANLSSVLGDMLARVIFSELERATA